jgi:hypothetical protein
MLGFVMLVAAVLESILTSAQSLLRKHIAQPVGDTESGGGHS